MQFRRIADLFGQAEPDLLVRRTLGRIELVARIHVAELERALPRKPALHLGRQCRQHFRRHARRGLDVLGLGHFRHRQLVLAAVLLLLERGGEEQDRLAVLDRGHAPHREAAAVAGAVDHVDDRRLDIAGAQEVAVQRMRRARFCGIHRRLCRRQRLAQHLAAEHVLGADITALAAEQVVLQALEREQFDQLGDGGGHGAGALRVGAAIIRVAPMRHPEVCPARRPRRRGPMDVDAEP